MQWPSILDIWTRLRNSMRTFLPGTDAWLEPNNLSIAGRAFSLTMDSAYSRLKYIYKQIFASSADAYHLQYRHAFEYGIERTQPAPAQGWIAFVETAPFQTIPADYPVTRSDGVAFTFLGDAIPDSEGNCTVQVRATTPGAGTNTLPNTPLNFASDPDLPCLPATATVGTGGLGGGADLEDIEHLRQRVLLRKRMPPHGGAESDYEQWLLAIPGVTRAFVAPFYTNNPNIGSSPLTLYPLFDDTRVNGIPTDADLAFVRAQITPLAPVTAVPGMYVAAPIVTPVNIVIGNLGNDSPALRAAIIAKLNALFRYGVEVATFENQFSLPRAWIDEAIMRSPGWSKHTLVTPATDVTLTPGQLPVLGTVAFA